MERKEVQDMVDLAIAKFHAENVVRMTRIEDRIIGIDGNGTGKIGALQKLDAKVEKVCTDVETLVRRSTSISKQSIVAVLGAIGIAAMGFVGSLAAEYVKHAVGWK